MSSFSQPDTDLVVPAFDVRALARRAAVPAALAAAAAVAIVVAGGPLHAFADALRRALDADPRWVIGGAVFELLSFAGYVALLWLVGSRATPRLGLRASAQVTLGGAAATRLLPTAGVGGAALTLWALRRAGLGSRGATRTLLAFLVVLYAVFLGAIAASGGADRARARPRRRAARAERRPGRRRHAGDRRRAGARRAPTDDRAASCRAACTRPPTSSASAVRDAIAHVRSADPRLLGALAWWAFDAAVLWAMLHALRRAAAVRRRRARLLRRPGRQHDPDPRRRQRRHRRRAARLRRRRPTSRSSPCSPTARSRSGCPRRSASPRSAPAPHDGALGRRGRSGRADAAPAPVARTPRPCPEPALLAA